MDKYLNNLYNQYCNSRGIENTTYDSSKLDADFYNWLDNYKNLLLNYKEYLISLNFIGDEEVAEVGKGIIDSLGISEFEIISPYAHTLKKEDKDLVVLMGTPFVFSDEGIFVYKGDTLLTYNMYDFSDVQNWYKVLNKDICDICVGIFGNINDCDYKKKVKDIKFLLEKTNKKCFVDYDVKDHNYYCVLHSNRKKGLTKVKK